MSSTEVNNYFLAPSQRTPSGAAVTPLVCLGAAPIILDKGLLDVIGAADYDALFKSIVLPLSRGALARKCTK